jgi:hypothetical protein
MRLEDQSSTGVLANTLEDGTVSAIRSSGNGIGYRAARRARHRVCGR